MEYLIEDRNDMLRVFKIAAANQEVKDTISRLYLKYVGAVNPNTKECGGCQGTVKGQWLALRQWYSENAHLFNENK